MLLGTHDFSGFSSKSKAGMQKKKRDTVRTLFAVDILPWKYGVYVSFTGDGFLYNMVREKCKTGTSGIRKAGQAAGRKDSK